MIDPTHGRALNHHQCVDEKGRGKVSHVKHNSLGHAVNHRWKQSPAKYKNRLILESIFGARESILVHGKGALARRRDNPLRLKRWFCRAYGIPWRVVRPGANLRIESYSKETKRKDTAEILRIRLNDFGVQIENAGLDLFSHSRGAGSSGVVLEVGFQGSKYAVKLDTVSCNLYERMSFLVEASVLGMIARRKEENRRVGAFSVSIEVVLEFWMYPRACPDQRRFESKSHCCSQGWSLWTVVSVRFRCRDEPSF